MCVVLVMVAMGNAIDKVLSQPPRPSLPSPVPCHLPRQPPPLCHDSDIVHLTPLFTRYIWEKHLQPEIKTLLLDPSSSFIPPFLLSTFLHHEGLSLCTSALLRSPDVIPLHPPAS